MAIYTYLEMFRDCSAGKPEGLRYLVQQFLPVIRWFHRKYSNPDLTVEAVLDKVRASDLFTPPGLPTVREFVAALGEKIARETSLAGDDSDASFDLEQFSKALEPLTATERQFIWFETMSYSPEETAAVMNLEASTIVKARERADDLLRQNLDSWSKGMVARSARQLRQMARESSSEKCLARKSYIEMLDGKLTWAQRRDYERQLSNCWHCVHQFCRIREADHVLNVTKPLPEAEAAKWWSRLGVAPRPKTFWAKVFTK